jgi:Carboxypeptidase regulatory-like domain
MLNASIFVLILSAALQARSVPGSLRGRVTDASGTAVSRAVVAAITEQGQIKFGITDTQGDYTIGNLSPGRYTIWAGVSGFSLYENTSFGVRAGRAQTLDICLRPNLGGSSAVRLEMAEVPGLPRRSDLGVIDNEATRTERFPSRRDISL